MNEPFNQPASSRGAQEARQQNSSDSRGAVRNPYLDSSSTSAVSGQRQSAGVRQMEGRPLASTGEPDAVGEKPGQVGPALGASARIQVHKRQERNAILRHVRNVPFQITPGLLADFVLGPKACAVFISLRYHLLYPNYLIQRIKELSRHFTLRVLLCHVDVDDSEKPLRDVNRMAVLNDFTFVLAWTLQEAARYLETYKAYEVKSAESIQERVEDDYLAKLQECLGVVRSLNKSDILTLASKFGSLKAVCDASASELALCPGLGDKKVLRLHETLHEPLSLQKAKKRQREES